MHELESLSGASASEGRQCVHGNDKVTPEMMCLMMTKISKNATVKIECERFGRQQHWWPPEFATTESYREFHGDCAGICRRLTCTNYADCSTCQVGMPTPKTPLWQRPLWQVFGWHTNPFS